MSTEPNAELDTTLERGYRRVLKLLPKTYRADHAEEMLSVLMDGARPGQSRPTARDVLSLAMLSVRLRFAAAAVRDANGSGRLAGNVARRAVLAFLIYDFGLLAQWIGFGAYADHPFMSFGLQAGLIAALILGWSRCGQAVCVAHCVYVTYNVQWRYLDFGWYATWVDLTAILLAPAVVLVVFRRGAPRLTGRRWWFLAFAAVTVAFWIRGKTVDHMSPFNIGHTPALSAVLYTAAVFMALRHVKKSPVWPMALMLAGLPEIAGYWSFGSPTDSTRDALYLDLTVGSEYVLIAVALASLAFGYYRRRAIVRP